MTIDRDELRQRIENVRALIAGSVGPDTSTEDADLRVWERHAAHGEPHFVTGKMRCLFDGQEWPCPDFVDLAARYGMTP